MSPQKRIVVTGASGLIGKALCRSLRTQGHTVVPIRWRYLELTPALLQSLEGADAIIHLAGTPIVRRWTKTAQREISDSRVAATRALSQALAQLQKKPACFIAMSGINRYGFSRPHEQLTEDSAVSTAGFLGQLCADWEAATQPAQAAGIRTINLRTGIVLAASGGALAQMLTPFKLGLGGPIGSGKQQLSWIQLEDLVALISWLLATPELQGPVNAVAPYPLSQMEFARALAAHLHRPCFLPLPAWAVKGLWGQMGQETLLADLAVYPQRALHHGFKFRTPDLTAALQLALSE